MSSNPLKNQDNEMSVGDVFDSLLTESFINRLRRNPRDVNLLSTFLTPSLPLISSSPDDGRDESGLGYVAKQEAKVEGVVIRTILSGDTDSLRPNSGQSVTICGHNICVGFHDEKGSEHRVWERHGHVMTYDENNSYSLKYIFGNYLERRRGDEGIWRYVL